MEKIPLQSSSLETASSREAVVIKKLQHYLSDSGEGIESLTEEQLLPLLSKKFKFPGTTPESVIAELKNFGYLKEPVVEKQEEKEEVPAEPEMISNYKKLQGITTVEGEEIQLLLEQNKFFEELSTNIFKNDKDLDAVYDHAIALEKDFPDETKEYYVGFEDLVKGGVEEIENDMNSLLEKQELFKNKKDALPLEQQQKVEKMKKIATIVECGIAHAVTNIGWYGDSVSIEPVSQFDDVKRGVDGVLQIREEGDQNVFLGLGVDATFRGLLSKEYADKFKRLLSSIEDGYKTKIKYFKNHQGEKMKEFAVPKIVLYFDNSDVKNLVGLVRNSGDTETTEDFKHSPQKITVMNQIMAQCELLADFASEYNNSISENYKDFIEAVKHLAEKEVDIQTILDSSKDNEVLKHTKFLIEKYKKGEL